MSEVVVVAPAGLALEGVAIATYGDGAEAVAALGAASGPAVLVSDGLDADDLDEVAAAVRGRGGAVIEVRLAPWDGETWSPVSAACRGVIAGFGPVGARAAVALVQREVAAG